MGYKKEIQLNPTDVDLIERSLRSFMDDTNQKEIIALLAKIHHQKIWFNPNKDRTKPAKPIG